ncbi:MAG: acyltransferase [Candidatus Obscuribacterales bacterium]|nr:acyltransferase [Candidatus Obscuribacterales bacterium]
MQDNDKVKPSRNLRFMDGLRGLAAFYVMVGHARWLLWEGYADGYLRHPEVYSVIDSGAMYFFSLFRYGHEAVMYFFVLSGFLIHLRLASKYSHKDQSNDSWLVYAKRRVRRIYPPLIACLIVTSICDYFGNRVNPAPYQTVAAFTNQPSLSYSIPTLIGNLLFAGSLRAPVWGSDGPLWSLSYEGWFYVIYPAFALLSKRSVWLPAAVSALLFAISFAPGWTEPLSKAIASMFVCWWCGAFLADVYCLRVPIKLSHVAFASIVLIPTFLFVQGIWRDVLCSIGFTGLVAFLLQLRGDNFLKNVLGKAKWLGDFSYSLYLTHVPVFCLLSALLRVYVFPGGTLPVSSGYLIPCVVLACVVAYLLHLIVERPFLKARHAE